MQIGIHHGGTFYEFVPWNGIVNFETTPWGYWYMSAENESHTVIISLGVFLSVTVV